MSKNSGALNSSKSFVFKVTYISVLFLFFPPARTHGESVTQMEGQVTLSEEDFLTIHCNYSASGYPTLFWYVQYPEEGPQLLLRASKANEKRSSRGFEATYDKGSNSFHLQKASVQESDSAVYYCALDDTVVETTGGAEHKLITRGLTAEFLPLGLLWFLCVVCLSISLVCTKSYG